MPRSTPRAETRRRIKRRRWRKPKLSLAQILAWADEHHRLTGCWPTRKSGRVRGTLEEDWNNLDNNLRKGDRGLQKGDSLARLLWRARGVRNPADPPPLTEGQILAWADAHHKRHGEWPTADSGKVIGEAEESWGAIDMSLRTGSRGLPGGGSLARLLARERGVANKQDLPRLTIRQILLWADQYHELTGHWPNDDSDPLSAMNGERWPAIDAALRVGNRGLPGDDSLPQLLARKRGVRNVHGLPRLLIASSSPGTVRLKNRIKGARAGKDGIVKLPKACQAGNRVRRFRSEPVCGRRLPRSMPPERMKETPMRCLLLASIVGLALGAAADSAYGDWAHGNWRTYGTANRTSPDGVWQRGYGGMGYGWYSAYGDYVGSDYSSIRFGYRNRAAGFNFNRIDNYGFTDPRAIGERAR